MRSSGSGTRYGSRLAALVLAAAALVVSTLVGTASEVEARPFPQRMGWQAAYQKYKELEAKAPLDLRALGIEYISLADKPEAITKVLQPRYEKPDRPEDYIRWVIVFNCFRNMGVNDYVDEWQGWALANMNGREHAWLWKRAMEVYAGSVSLDWPRQIARGLDAEGEEIKKLDPYIRAAAFEVLADHGDLEACGLAVTALEDKKLLKADDEQAMWLGTFARLFEMTSHMGKEDHWQALGTLLIPWIEEKKLPKKTQITMVRAFSRAFSTEELFLNADPWILRLKQAKLGVEAKDSGSGGESDRYAKPKKPPFMGVQGSGTRIAYVIDCSDSMLEPLKREEIEDIKKPKEDKGPITGGDKDKERAKKKEEEERKKKAKNPGDELPWDKINNRWDCAREALILSLKGLEKDMYFTVILFGDQAEYLKCSKGLVQASSANINKAIGELERVPIGSPEPDRRRPHGTLKGATNLHGGMRLAYKAMEGGFVKDYEYVDKGIIPTGVDTIFVLSDGEPTYDDFVKEDEYYDGYHVGDPETGQPGQVQPILIYHGPYHLAPYITDDIERMNLFNKCEINCIAIGEARDDLLRDLAARGHGEFRRVAGGR